MRRNILCMLWFIISIPVLGQVNFQFVPELHGRNVDGLLNLKIINASASQTVSLTLVVSEQRHGKVLSIKTGPFTLRNGSNSIPVAAVRSARIQFSGNRIATVVEENSYFPEGEYEYCFTINSVSGLAPAEQCINYELVPTAPLGLIEPYNRDKICERRPLLSWQPSFPHIPGSAYQLVLVEIKGKQNATEALNYNLPIITLGGITNPILPYPASSKELVPGKKYAWQVSSYKNQTVLNRSEVWEFTVECKDTLANPVLVETNYRDIEDLLEGNYYVADGQVNYVIVNSYSEQSLKYEIKCITRPSLKVKRLPYIRLKEGKNKVHLNLMNNSSFKDGYSYIMSVWLPNGAEKELRFLYREPK